MSPRPGAGAGLADLELRDRREGCTVAVRVRPGARRNGLVCVRHGALLVDVTAAAEKGRANAALCELLAAALGIARGALEVVVGGSRRQKVVQLSGLSAAAARDRLAAFLGADSEPS